MSGPRRVIAGAAGQHLSQGSYGATNTCGDAAREKTVGEGRSAGGGGLAFLCSMPWLIEGRSSVRGRVASREFTPPGTCASDILRGLWPRYDPYPPSILPSSTGLSGNSLSRPSRRQLWRNALSAAMGTILCTVTCPRPVAVAPPAEAPPSTGDLPPSFHIQSSRRITFRNTRREHQLQGAHPHPKSFMTRSLR